MPARSTSTRSDCFSSPVAAEFGWSRGAASLGPLIGTLGAVVHFPALLSDAELAPQRVGVIAGTIGIAVIAGRALTGVLLDRVPARLVMTVFFAMYLLGGAIGPGVLGALYDLTGGYRVPMLAASACLVTAGLLSLRVGSLPQRF